MKTLELLENLIKEINSESPDYKLYLRNYGEDIYIIEFINDDNETLAPVAGTALMLNYYLLGMQKYSYIFPF